MASRTSTATSKRYFFVFLSILLLVVGALGGSALVTFESTEGDAAKQVAATQNEEGRPTSATP